MGKKQSKSERIDLILSELQKLKGEIKALSKQQAELAVEVCKLLPRKSTSAPPSKTAKSVKPADTGAARKASAAPKRPVLVSGPAVPRTGAQ